LIIERKSSGVFCIHPGITILEQINGIDSFTQILLAELDARIFQDMGTQTYFKYMIKTVTCAGRGDRIRKE
jgi:O-antigen biosynthesis protein WbqP